MRCARLLALTMLLHGPLRLRLLQLDIRRAQLSCPRPSERVRARFPDRSAVRPTSRASERTSAAITGESVQMELAASERAGAPSALRRARLAELRRGAIQSAAVRLGLARSDRTDSGRRRRQPAQAIIRLGSPAAQATCYDGGGGSFLVPMTQSTRRCARERTCPSADTFDRSPS